MAGQKPLAVRVLEQRNVPFELFEFDSSIRSADEVARATGMPPETVFKTLVIEQEPPRRKPFLLMMPSSEEVDLKVLADSLGLKRVRMASHADAERHTGLKVGGISLLALLSRGFTALIDESAVAIDEILVSAGQRGMEVRLAVRDLLMLTGAIPVRTH